MEHLINVGRRSFNNRVLFSAVVRQRTTIVGEGVSALTSSSSSSSPSLSSFSFKTTIITPRRTYAAKKPAQLTEAQIQFQKHTAELGFKEKTSIRGTLYEYHDVDTSIKYMKSEAFRTAYGDKLLWKWFIRNHKGRFPRLITRLDCVGRDGRYITGNPCPVCRDPYLVVNYRNLDLLRVFVSPDTGYLLPARITNVCQRTQENLRVAYEKACDHGLIDHPIPHRAYSYRQYMTGTDAAKRVDGGNQVVNDDEKPSVLLGVILGANRKGINYIYDELKEEDITLATAAHPLPTESTSPKNEK